MFSQILMDFKNKRFLINKTKKARHFVVRIMAPFVWQEWVERHFILFVKKALKKPLIGVEIGVAAGENAERMLKILPIKTLYLVDPYEPYETDGVLITDYVNMFEEAKKRLSKFKNRVVFIQKTSEEAVDDIPNELDFVYIDGNHSYKFVKKDIELYYQKVKVGGIIGGHDFCASCIGVTRAVLEFVDKNGLKLHGRGLDWWIVKS